MVAIDPEFSGARQHALALHAFDHRAANRFLAQRRPGRDPRRKHARPHIRSAAHNHCLPAATSVNCDRLVLTLGKRRDIQHASGKDVIKMRAGRLNALAFAVFIVMRRCNSAGSLSRPGTSSEIHWYENFKFGSLYGPSKLAEKPQIPALKLADIVDSVPHHGEPRQSE